MDPTKLIRKMLRSSAPSEIPGELSDAFVPVISCLSTKGSVGKSTVNAKIAEYAALRLGLRVAYLDLDFHASGVDAWLGPENQNQLAEEELVAAHKYPLEAHNAANVNSQTATSILDLWLGEMPMPCRTPLSKPGVYEGKVDLFPCDQVKYLKVKQLLESMPKKMTLLNEFIQKHLSGEYDLVVMDIGSALTNIRDACEQSLTHASLILKPEPGSDSHLPGLIARMEDENARRESLDLEPVTFLGFTVNQYTARKVHKARLSALNELYGKDMVLPVLSAREWLSAEKSGMNGVKPFSLFKYRDTRTLNNMRSEWMPYMESLFSGLLGVEVGK